MIDRGRRVRAALLQPQFQPLSTAHQVALLQAIEDGLLDGSHVAMVGRFREAVLKLLTGELAMLALRIEQGAVLTDEEQKQLRTAMQAVVARLEASEGADVRS